MNNSTLFQGFISYSHRDKEAMERLVIHLRSIERISNFRFWYDERRLKAGDQFDQKITDAIASSTFFLLLLSPDFFASDYIFEKELPAISHRLHELNCCCVPVILKPCLYEPWVEGILSVPKPPSIVEWVPTDRGFDAASHDIFRKLVDLYSLELSPLAKRFLAGAPKQ